MLEAQLRAGPATCLLEYRGYQHVATLMATEMDSGKIVAVCHSPDGADIGAGNVAVGVALNDPETRPDYSGLEAAARAGQRGICGIR